MAKQLINLGTEANDGTGDTLRTGAFKINQNFNELYAAVGNGINAIVAGEGIGVSGSFGQVAITNTRPNQGSFNTIEVIGEDDITTDQLTDTLRFVAGQNVTLTTSPGTNSITISVAQIDVVDLNGTFSGTFSGTVTGNVTGALTGDVISTDIDTSLLKISGNPEAAQSYYLGLIGEQNATLNDLNDLQDMLVGYNGTLLNLQANLSFWQSQAPSSERTAQIASLSGQIASIQSQINGIQLQISQKQSDLASIGAEINRISPTLNTPYTSLTYNTVDLLWSADAGLVIPRLILGDLTYPNFDGTAGQAIVTDGTGNLSWSSILGNFQIVSNRIVPKTYGQNVSLESYESAADAADGSVSLLYVPDGGSTSMLTSVVVGPTGIDLVLNEKNVNLNYDGIVYASNYSSSFPQSSQILPSATSVVYTSIASSSQTLKLLVLAQCDQDIQSSEIIVAKNDLTVVCSVYGVVYTSVDPFCTFNAQWNSISGRIEITATNLNLTTAVSCTVQGNELSNL